MERPRIVRETVMEVTLTDGTVFGPMQRRSIGEEDE